MPAGIRIKTHREFCVYIHCKEKLGREEMDGDEQFPPLLSLPMAGSDLSLAQALGAEHGEFLLLNDGPGQ